MLMPDLTTKPTLADFLQLMRINRPIGTFLLLWPTLWALWLAAKGSPDSTLILIFIAGTFVMRAAGCVVNDIADRDFDPHVERTRNRPMARGVISVHQALILFALLVAVALILVLQLNSLAIKISFVAAAVAVIYPFTKRVTHLPQFVLGIAFSMGIPMAYAAVLENLPVEMWMIFLANFLWIVAYDTQYAMTDREDDLVIGVKSTAILFAKYDNLIVGLLHLCALIVLTAVGTFNNLNWHYYLGLVAAGGFAIYQQFLCRHRKPDQCLKAFINNNWFGASVFLGIVLSFTTTSL